MRWVSFTLTIGEFENGNGQASDIQHGSRTFLTWFPFFIERLEIENARGALTYD